MLLVFAKKKCRGTENCNSSTHLVIKQQFKTGWPSLHYSLLGLPTKPLWAVVLVKRRPTGLLRLRNNTFSFVTFVCGGTGSQFPQAFFLQEVLAKGSSDHRSVSVFAKTRFLPTLKVKKHLFSSNRVVYRFFFSGQGPTFREKRKTQSGVVKRVVFSKSLPMLFLY